MLKQAGLSITLIIRVLELEKNVDHRELPFLERDIRTFLGKVKRIIKKDDVTMLLDYFKQENPHFQYVFKVDDERRLEHLFLSPTQYFDWRDKFGDLVVPFIR